MPIYRLRWVFRWVDGKVRRGIWNGASNRFEDTAASINKTGLIQAAIEGEHVTGYGIKTLFECDGHDYASASWMAASSMPALIGKINAGSVRLIPDIIGLSFTTRNERVSVFVDGSISRRPNTEYEKQFKLREHRG